MGGGTREMWGHWVPRHTEDMPLPRAGLLSCLSCSQSPWASTPQPLPPQISCPMATWTPGPERTVPRRLRCHPSIAYKHRSASRT